MLQAVVMAGGRGQRLQPLTLGRPKPLVPLFGRPLLGYLVQHLRERGVDEVFVTAGHLGEQIAAYVGSLPAEFRVRCRIESCPRGTAGAVADLLPQLRSPFLVVSGDAVLDLDVAGLCAAHERGGNVATICLAPPSERLRFGTVALTGARVQGFVEKPPLAEIVPGMSINTGCYLVDRTALEAIAGRGAGRAVDFALDVFPDLLGRGAPVGAAAAARYWRDIGTLEAYREAHFDGLAGRLPWTLPEPEIEGNVEIGSGARVEGAVHIGRGARLGAGTRVIGPAVVGAGCQVGRGAQVTRSVLLEGCRVGARAVVTDSVVDAGAWVAPGAHAVGAGLAGRAGRSRAGMRLVPAGRGRAAADRMRVAQGDGARTTIGAGTTQGDVTLPEGNESAVAAAPAQ